MIGAILKQYRDNVLTPQIASSQENKLSWDEKVLGPKRKVVNMLIKHFRTLSQLKVRSTDLARKIRRTFRDQTCDSS